MYAVSAAFQAAMKNQVQHSRVTFDLDGTSYGSENILAGSFRITNQCTDTADITLGAVYTGQLKATLRGINIARNAWQKKEIIPTYELEVETDVWESVPLGVFTISEANWTRSGVDITAYDNMAKFDKKTSLNQSGGYLYDFLYVACEECHVTLAHTQQEIEAMPNGSTYFNYYSENDVETWRDIVSWVAQTLGGFATINRDGELEIRHYSTVPVDTIDYAHRDRQGSFSDYITKYTGISYLDLANQKTIYTGAEVDDGSTMNLGSNPFLQTQAQATAAVQVLLGVIAEITYTPFKTTVIGNPGYDLGDPITFSGGLAGSESLGCMQRYTFDFHKRFEMSGYGANPEMANARSKTDKTMAGLLQNVSGDVMQFYELRNVSKIKIKDNEKKQIIRLKLASIATARVEIHININLETLSQEEEITAEEIEQELKYSLARTTATASYIIDGEEQNLHPEESYINGKHVLHLMYILQLTANVTSYFRVYMTADGGDISIDRNGVWLYASGYGIVGDGTWDGTFDLEDETERFQIRAITFAEAADSVIISTQTPQGASISETTETIRWQEPGFKADATDRVRITMHNTADERVLENEIDTRTLEDEAGTGEPDIRYTEEEIS